MNDPTQVQEISLTIEINNKKPVELVELTKSLIALGNQYNNFIQKNGGTEEEKNAKLYIKEVRHGSIIFDLVDYVVVGMIPFVENVNSVAAFAILCKKAFDFFTGKSETVPEGLTVQDYKDFSQMVQPIVSDRGSAMNVGTTVNGNHNIIFNINNLEANAAQNICRDFIEKSKQKELNSSAERVVMSLYQTRSNVEKDTGNKATIDAIHNRPVNIIFDDENIKLSILKGDDNPYLYAYLVDVKIETAAGKIIAYRITKLHESFKIEDN